MSELNGDITHRDFAVEPLTKLNALDTLFEATGVAYIKVTRYDKSLHANKEIMIPLPIQSVNTEEAQALAGRPPQPPRVASGPNRYSEDTNNPQYQQQLAEHTRKFLMAMACFGLAIDIEDATGAVVWSADNKIRNFDASREVLKRMGLVDGQLMSLVRAIRELTTEAEEQVASD